MYTYNFFRIFFFRSFSSIFYYTYTCIIRRGIKRKSAWPLNAIPKEGTHVINIYTMRYTYTYILIYTRIYRFLGIAFHRLSRSRSDSTRSTAAASTHVELVRRMRLLDSPSDSLFLGPVKGLRTTVNRCIRFNLEYGLSLFILETARRVGFPPSSLPTPRSFSLPFILYFYFFFLSIYLLNFPSLCVYFLSYINPLYYQFTNSSDSSGFSIKCLRTCHLSVIFVLSCFQNSL